MSAASLDGKVALVTGAGRGIGREIALKLASEGAAVIVHYASSDTGARQTADEIIAKGGQAWIQQADISKRPQVLAMFERIAEAPGHVDIIVNNSGVSVAGTLRGILDEDIEHNFGINMLGPLYVVSAAYDLLRDGGRIINFSSSVAKYPLAGARLYSAAKKAIESFTESWSRELGNRNITVNSVIPGATSPGMMDAAGEYLEFFENSSPFKRIGRAEEVANVVAFLASPGASWVSGTHVLVNGAANT